jgi:hypothetical protein
LVAAVAAVVDVVVEEAVEADAVDVAADAENEQKKCGNGNNGIEEEMKQSN